MIFVTKEEDANGIAAARVLAARGFKVNVLPEGTNAKETDIALFTPPANVNLQGARGRYLRTSAVKLTEQYAPCWALGTQFRVGVLKTSKSKAKFRNSQNPNWGFEGALVAMAQSYKSWLAEGSRELVPWTTSSDSVVSGSACEARIKQWLENQKVQEFRREFMIKKSPEERISTVKVGQWDVYYCDKPVVFPAWAAERAISMLKEWPQHFAAEQTWVRGQIGIPSLFVRFDCVIRDGELAVYEIEERPAGMGVSSLVSSEFASSFKRIASTWPEFRVEISPLRRATDDHLWVERMGWQKTQSNLVLVRAEPEETQYHSLEPFSVSSLKAKGNKSYGVRMGLWKRVSSADDLPWNEAFVVKPLSGSKVRDLEFWDPLHRPGSSNEVKVRSELLRQGEMYMQKLHPPMETGIKQFPWMIFRIFFGFNPQSRTWTCLGGNWNARHNLRIHGATDAIFGPALVE